MTARLRREAIWWALAALVTLPVWCVRYIPAQDLPQHMTVIRILRSYRDPAFDFASTYAVVLGRTTYVLFYGIGVALAFVLGVRLAAKVLVAAYLAGTFLGTRYLARAIGNDERVALFSVPLLVNPLFDIGLFPFLLGLTLMLWAIAAGILFAREPTIGRGAATAILGVLLIVLHPIPYLMFVLAMGAQVGAAILANRHDRRLRVRAPVLGALVLAPSLAICLRWLIVTDSGAVVGRMIAGHNGRGHPPFLDSLRGIFGWVGDTFRDRSDDYLFGAALAAAWVAFVAARCEGPTYRGAARALAIVPIAAALVYFFGSTEAGYSWPLSQRYALVAAVAAVPLLRLPRGVAGRAWSLAAGAIAVAVVVNDVVHFVRFDREARSVDAALATIPPRAHVASLVFESESNVVRFYPYLHFGAWAQVDHGGVVKFSFVGFDHWPIDFRDGQYPPPGGPAASGWEWHPDRVPSEELAPYFDHVLVRGEWPSHGAAYVESSASGAWHVWSLRP